MHEEDSILHDVYYKIYIKILIHPVVYKCLFSSHHDYDKDETIIFNILCFSGFTGKRNIKDKTVVDEFVCKVKDFLKILNILT